MKKFHAKLRDLGFATYADYLASDLWLHFKSTYKRSNRPQRCMVCQSNQIELHHNDYSRLGCEKLTDVVPLCREHHEAVHAVLTQRLWQVDKTTDAIAFLLSVDKVPATPIKEPKPDIRTPELIEEFKALRFTRPHPAIPTGYDPSKGSELDFFRYLKWQRRTLKKKDPVASKRNAGIRKDKKNSSKLFVSAQGHARRIGMWIADLGNVWNIFLVRTAEHLVSYCPGTLEWSDKYSRKGKCPDGIHGVLDMLEQRLKEPIGD